MKISTATSVLFQHALWDAIPLIAGLGYKGVDIWGGRPHVYRQDLSQADLVQLRKLMDDHDLRVSSFMPAFYRYPHSLSNPNPNIINDSIEYMQVCIDNAVALGAPIVLVVPDHSLHGQSRQDSLKRLMDSIDRVADYAGQHESLMLGIEILYDDETDMVNSATDALLIINQLGHANIGVVLDTGTLNLSKESPADIFTTLGKHILQVHINDNVGHRRQQNLIPGEGTYDFQQLIHFLGSVGYTGFLTAELSKEYADDPEPALRLTARRLHTWMQAVTT